MNQMSSTALLSAYTRIYHVTHHNNPVIEEVDWMVSNQEYQEITSHLVKGISFFNPTFIGDDKEALDWIVTKLSGATLARVAYSEKRLEQEVKLNAKQYLILGAGLDSFAVRRPNYAEQLNIFELDHPDMSQLKMQRISESVDDISNLTMVGTNFNHSDWIKDLLASGFKPAKTFCSILGLSYYLKKDEFIKMLKSLYTILEPGSCMVLDYPNELTLTEDVNPILKKQMMMATAADESMLDVYSYQDLEMIMNDIGFLIYEHLNHQDIEAEFFKEFNQTAHVQLTPYNNINFCMIAKI